MCEYQTKFKNALTRHGQVKHEGIRYPCGQCNALFSTKFNLSAHQKTAHENCQYTCDPCDYKGTTQSHLKRHMKSSRHENVKIRPKSEAEII